MKRKLGISCNCIKDEDPLNTLDMIKQVGFDCFFVSTGVEKSKINEIAVKGKKLGLDFEFIHAPFKNINNLFMPGMDYKGIMNGIKESIDAAAENNVPSVITHVSSGWNPPELTDLALSRFDEIVNYAEQKGVTLAFENLRMIGNLAYLCDRYRNCDNVRFCYDNGHEYCYTKTVSWIDIFGRKIITTHIHDNFGRGEERVGDPDLHLLPFDGDFNYEKMIRKLDEYGYEGPLCLEISNKVKPEYLEMKPIDFIKTAFERIKKISEM